MFDLHHRGHSFFFVFLCFQYKLMSGGLNSKTVTAAFFLCYELLMLDKDALGNEACQ